MNIVIPAWAIKLGLKENELLVFGLFLNMIDAHDSNGEGCDISLKRIGECLGINKTTAGVNVRKLVEKGFLTYEEKGAGIAKKRYYFLNFEKIDEVRYNGQ